MGHSKHLCTNSQVRKSQISACNIFTPLCNQEFQQDCIRHFWSVFLEGFYLKYSFTSLSQVLSVLFCFCYLFCVWLCFRERNCLLKEAEVLHKARFNYIIQIFGVCNEPRIFCIVTEFMSNGSLDRLLHEVAHQVHFLSLGTLLV